MTFTVYGIRLKGDREVRYIGQTSGKPGVRLSSHLCASYCPEFSNWLRANRESVETFEFTRCASRKEALAIERLTIKLCVRLNHRLFNRDHVPTNLRLVPPELRAA